MLTKLNIKNNLDDFEYVVYNHHDEVVAIGSRSECSEKLCVSERAIVHSATASGLRVFNERRSDIISVAIYMPELLKELNVVGHKY